MDKAIANFNMTFNEGHFKKGTPYSYEYADDNNSIIITTEEGNKSKHCRKLRDFFLNDKM